MQQPTGRFVAWHSRVVRAASAIWPPLFCNPLFPKTLCHLRVFSFPRRRRSRDYSTLCLPSRLDSHSVAGLEKKEGDKPEKETKWKSCVPSADEGEERSKVAEGRGGERTASDTASGDYVACRCGTVSSYPRRPPTSDWSNRSQENARDHSFCTALLGRHSLLFSLRLSLRRLTPTPIHSAASSSSVIRPGHVSLRFLARKQGWAKTSQS